MINAMIKIGVITPIGANQFRDKMVTIYRERYAFDRPIESIRADMGEAVEEFRKHNPWMENAPMELIINTTEHWSL